MPLQRWFVAARSLANSPADPSFFVYRQALLFSTHNEHMAEAVTVAVAPFGYKNMYVASQSSSKPKEFDS